jgi:hypothetical protein
MGRFAPTPPWESFEVVLRGVDRRSDREQQTPFSDELFSGDGDPIQTALQKMWLVQSHGWPEAIRQLRDGRGKPLIDRADDADPAIWILKCKPSCWRLYFHVYIAQSRIAYLYAKCKKRTRREAADSVRARRLFDGLRPGGSALAPFPFPRD